MAESRVLDTNLLFDLALARFVSRLPEGAQKWKAWGALHVLKTQDAIDRLATTARRHRVVTTHLVLSEVGVLARRTLWPKDVSGGRSRTWPFLEGLREAMAELQLNVHALPGEARADLRVKFGPTDADLVAVTLQLSKDPGGSALLTTDEDLMHWCEENDVRCDYFDPLTPPSG